MVEKPTKLSDVPILNLHARKPGQLKTFDMDPSILSEIKRVDRLRSAGDKNNDLPVVDVDIPDTVIIRCPLVSQVSIQAKQCKGCPHFQGVAQMAWSDESYLYWSQKYVVRCGRVVERTCGEVMP